MLELDNSLAGWQPPPPFSAPSATDKHSPQTLPDPKPLLKHCLHPALSEIVLALQEDVLTSTLENSKTRVNIVNREVAIHCSIGIACEAESEVVTAVFKFTPQD